MILFSGVMYNTALTKQSSHFLYFSSYNLINPNLPIWATLNVCALKTQELEFNTVEQHYLDFKCPRVLFTAQQKVHYAILVVPQ